MAPQNENSEQQSDHPKDKPRGRGWVRWIIGACGILTIIFGAGVYWRLPLATAALRAGLDSAGLHHVAFTVSGLSASRLRLTNVHMKPEAEPELSIATAEAEFDLFRLPDNPLTRLTLRGVQSDLTGNNTKPATPAAPLTPNTIRALLDQAAKVPAIVIKDLSLRLATAGSSITLTGSVEAGPQDSGNRTVNFELQISGDLADKTHTVSLDGLTRIQTAAATVNIKAKTAYRGKGGKLSRHVKISSRLSLIRNMLTFDNNVVLPDTSIASAKGRHDLASGQGTVSLVLPARQLTALEKELRTLAPSILEGSSFTIQSGTLQAKVALAWGEQGLNGTATVGIKDLDLVDSTSGSTIQGLSAYIQLDQIIPPRTPHGQTVRINQISAGVPLNDLSLRFALINGVTTDIPALQIEEFKILVAGGQLSIESTVVDSAADTNQATIMVKNIDLSTVLSAIGLDGVSGTGRMSGRIPISMTGKTIRIAGGLLAAAKPGVLRIRSEAVKNALAQGGEQVALMLSALEDFRYETLTLKIEKEVAGQGRIVLQTRGQNPAVRAGQPFIINLNLSGNVDRLVAVAAQAFQLPGTLVRAMLPKQP